MINLIERKIEKAPKGITANPCFISKGMIISLAKNPVLTVDVKYEQIYCQM